MLASRAGFSMDDCAGIWVFCDDHWGLGLVIWVALSKPVFLGDQKWAQDTFKKRAGLVF